MRISVDCRYVIMMDEMMLPAAILQLHVIARSHHQFVHYLLVATELAKHWAGLGVQETVHVNSNQTHETIDNEQIKMWCRDVCDEKIVGYKHVACPLQSGSITFQFT